MPVQPPWRARPPVFGTVSVEHAGIEAIAVALAQGGPGGFGAGADRDVEWLQTHISHVFLTSDRVFKLRKSVDLGFVDFSTRARRNADCLAELRLNRRLSPEVYLGIAPIVAGGGGFRVGRLRTDPAPADLDPTSEHCVVMKRLPAGRDARSMVEGGTLEAHDIDAVVERLVQFHAAHGLGRPAPGSPEQWRERVWRVVSGNFDSMRGRDLGTPWCRLVARVETAASAAFERLQLQLDCRWREGCMVDGHGDLHLEHIWFPDASRRPVFVDCIEFNDAFRLIDRASEIAFLVMDLTYRRRRDLAERALAVYAELTDDYRLFSVVDFYASYRAAVRAKVAALTSDEHEVPRAQRDAAASSAMRHLELAGRYLEQRPSGAVVCMTGTVGSGKTTAARTLADRIGAVTISTDGVRRRLVESSPERRGERYGLQRRLEVYAAVFERAVWALRSGRTVILDATFESAAMRRAAMQCASALGAPAFLVRTRVPAAVAAARLQARRRDARERSEAGPAELEGSLARYEEPTEWPPSRRFTIDTDAEAWTHALEPIAQALLAVDSRDAELPR